MVVAVFHKLKQNRKSDDDDAVHKPCIGPSRRYKVQTVKLIVMKLQGRRKHFDIGPANPFLFPSLPPIHFLLSIS